MNGFNLTSFYNHSQMKKDIAEFNLLDAKIQSEIRNMKVEFSPIQLGDIIESTGNGSRIEGCKGLVVSKEYNGKFLRFCIDWDYTSKKRKHCKTFERKQDIRRCR